MQLFKFEFSAMACVNEIQVYGVDKTDASRFAQAGTDEVRRIEKKYSRYRDDSLLSQINRAAGQSAVRVDDETAALLDYGAACFTNSGGLFDLTSGVLRRCWNFREATLPDPEKINESSNEPEIKHRRIRRTRSGQQVTQNCQA